MENSTLIDTDVARRSSVFSFNGQQYVDPSGGNAKALKCAGIQEGGGPPGTRTLNQLIKSQLLCQLS
jgi:hypothetical protein